MKKKASTKRDVRSPAPISPPWAPPPPSLRALRESVLVALGTTSLSGCWSFEPSDCLKSAPADDAQSESSGYHACHPNLTAKIGPARCRSLDEYNGPPGEVLCSLDEDCTAGQVCACPQGGFGRCVESNCSDGGDCASGFCAAFIEEESGDSCGPPDGFGDRYQVGCFSTESDCSIDADCGGGGRCLLLGGDTRDLRGYCTFEEEEEESSSFFVACGRPMLERGVSLEAPLERGEGWRSSTPPASASPAVTAASQEGSSAAVFTDAEALSVALAALPPAQQRALLERWSAIARLEHSSVASFARVTLELMALGAPAALLAETQRAAQDELRHAQQAIDVVSALRGEEVRFGAFPGEGLAIRGERDAVLRALIEEACLGECLGVAEAEGELTAMRQAGGPAALIARVEQVVVDESRHAALAWRTLAWLLDGDQPAEEERARRAELVVSALLQESRKQLDPLMVDEADEADGVDGSEGLIAPALGLISPRERAAVRLRALTEVVLPAAVELFGEERLWPLIHLAEEARRQEVLQGVRGPVTAAPLQRVG